MGATELAAVVASQTTPVPPGHRITTRGALPVEPLGLQELALVAQQVREAVAGVPLAGIDGHLQHCFGRSDLTAIFLKEESQLDGAVQCAALVPGSQHLLRFVEVTAMP